MSNETAPGLDDMLRAYRELAIAVGDISNPKRQNQRFDQLHAYYKKLRNTQEGRDGIAQLMRDANPFVRLAAAAHSLDWRTEEARRVLEELRDSDGEGAFTAKWTLKEFERGRLRFDF